MCFAEEEDARLRVEDFASRSNDLGDAPHTCYLGRGARWLRAAEVQGYHGGRQETPAIEYGKHSRPGILTNTGLPPQGFWYHFLQ
jgi:hypothetical protein